MKYRTKDGLDYTLPGIGRTTNGIIVTDKIIENANFELVEDNPQVAPPQAPTSPAPQAAAPPQPTVPVQPAPLTNQGSNI